jgi:pimeloyl-ACP methyl ester carboxylesterase
MDAEKLRRLLFTPMRTQPPGDTGRILDQASRTIEVVDGDDVVHYVWGDGERRVLLVHGWSGNAGHVAALADALAMAGFTVVAPDQPGHGESGGRESSVVHFAKATAVAQERHGPFCAVVAHSLGAIAATYAMSRGLDCERAVFVNPASSFTSIWRRNEKVIGLSSELMGSVVTSAEKWLGVSFDAIEPTVLAPGLSSKLLVVHDEHDPETPMSDSTALVGAWPGAELVRVEKLGHTRVLSDIGVIRRVVDFLAA